MSYEAIDPVIRAWAEKRQIHIFTSYKDYEVRSADLVDQKGRRYQIWIDPPDEQGTVKVHVWDFGKKRKDYVATHSDLMTALDEAFVTASRWMKEEAAGSSA